MALSLFLAKLLGLYLLIVAFDLLVRRREAEGVVKDFAASKGLLFYSGSLSLLLGLAIAIAHPIWEANWRGLITLLAYLMIVRGLMRTAFPSFLQKRIYPFFRSQYWFLLIILIIFGVYLTYSGFNAQAVVP